MLIALLFEVVGTSYLVLKMTMGKARKTGKRGKFVIMNYYNKAMFTLYRIVKRSITESVPDKAFVHTRIAFQAVSAPEQYYSAPLRCRKWNVPYRIGFRNCSSQV